MSMPYWADPRYAKIICERVPDTQGWHQSQKQFPLLEFQFGDKPPHYAVAPGFLSPSTPEDLQDILAFSQDLARKEDGLTAFLQYRGDLTKTINAETINDVIAHHCSVFALEERTLVIIPLGDEEDMIAASRKDTRSRLRQALKTNLRFSLELHADFHQLYHTIAEENGFSDSYQYSAKDFEDICNAEGIWPISVFDGEDQFLGGSIIGRVNDALCDYIISAYAKNIANSGRAILWESLQAASSLGFNEINLGGGVTEGDALFSFKMSFGGEARSFYSLKLIYDEELYRSIYNISQEIDLSGRFPPK